MRLLRCDRPSGVLEAAPRTALAIDTPNTLWDGFWSTQNDAYFARCSHADGTESWYCIADETRPHGTRPLRAARVLALRPAAGRRYPVTRHMLVLRDAGDQRRSMLVGSSRRGALSAARRDLERAP